MVKNLLAMQETWVGEIPWRRKRQPTPVFLSGKSHGQRSLSGYSPWTHKEPDMTEHAHTHSHSHTHTPSSPSRAPSTNTHLSDLTSKNKLECNVNAVQDRLSAL